jgi:hypothetical protein
MLPTTSLMKSAVFWVVAPCSLVEVYRRFRGACCLHHQGDDGDHLHYMYLCVSQGFIHILNIFKAGFEVLTAVSTKMAVFWIVAPCSLVEVYQHFSEKLVNFYQTRRHYNPEDSHLNI